VPDAALKDLARPTASNGPDPLLPPQTAAAAPAQPGEPPGGVRAASLRAHAAEPAGAAARSADPAPAPPAAAAAATGLGRSAVPPSERAAAAATHDGRRRPPLPPAPPGPRGEPLAPAPRGAVEAVPARAATAGAPRAGAALAAGMGAGESAYPVRRSRAGAQGRAGSFAPSARRSRHRGPRSPARATLLIVGGVLVGAAAIAIALFVLAGGSSSKHAASSVATATTHLPSTRSHKHSRVSSSRHAAPVSNPGATSVIVLNGTLTTGLAHRISSQLQAAGYSQAAALGGRPPGANQSTIVEYASGHGREAQGVARSLEVTHVQPMESTVSSLSGSAAVVVIAGLDKASTVP
jgi:LytR cell envelope-related transcriptional attenuator